MGILKKTNANQKLDKYSKIEIKKIMPIIKQIESLRSDFMLLSNEELRFMTEDFRFRLNTGETLEDILPEAYALVREVDRRVLGKEPYRVQLMGAIILHQGRIAELKTGEGKTLLGTLPAYLNALAGEGVHIVTVNEYLAQRDSNEMRQVHEFLGLTVGCVLSGMTNKEKQDAYNCDITYVTNSEVGFDYLRDNMVSKKSEKVQRKLAYAIIDEVDSVLIDEARTPLIISGSSKKSTLFYGTFDILAKKMIKGSKSNEFNKSKSILGEEFIETGDFIVDEKDKIITLTEEGIKKAEEFLHIDNLSSSKHLEEHHGLITALRANYLMKSGSDYIVKDNQVLIVDTFTGRIMDGRRYADGLHQAIEAKERVEINKETQTEATITYQNFFNKYKKKCGMTGTGKSEELEFKEIYYLDVVEIPTNKPVIRKDLEDLVFKTEDEKIKAICDEVEATYNSHQPVLVGVTSVVMSEKISKHLNERGIPHAVLNAKNDSLEADIIAHAGEIGKVTVATNMAGRGTDIKITKEAESLGGLKVIGTERNESRRIDDQLRGRSGRQGDPGQSQFFLSLDDDLMKLFARDKWIEIFEKNEIQYGKPISHKKIHKAVEEAQRRIENNNYGIRKQVFEYDNVNNQHRESIYGERAKIINGEEVQDVYKRAIDYFIKDKLNESYVDGKLNLELVNNNIDEVIPFKKMTEEDCYGLSEDEIINLLKKRVLNAYNSYIFKFGKDELNRYERQILLLAIDSNWRNHLESMDYLKQWIGVQSYGQKDPRFEYKRVAGEILTDTIHNIYIDTIYAFFTGKMLNK